MNVFRSLRAAAFGVALSAAPACSFLFDVDDTQCQKDSDCEERGDEFKGSVCVQNLCHSPVAAAADCTSNADCSGAQICQAAKCTNLKTSECPVVLGEDHLRSPAPILVGAYAAMSALNPSESNMVRNFQLALDEFTGKEDGLPGGPDGQRRPFSIVVCDTVKGLDRSMTHLVDVVGAAGIIATLDPQDLRDAFTTKGGSTLLFSPLFADTTVTSLSDNGLIWTLSPSATAIVPPYQPLLERVQEHLQLTEPMRVALLVETEQQFADLGDGLANTLNIDGTPLVQLPSSRYRRLIIDSDPSDPENTVASAKKVILTELKPHVIIAATGFTFPEMAIGLEGAWPTLVGGTPPFYLLDYIHAFYGPVQNFFNEYSSVAQRTLGVNFETNPDLTLYYQYLDRFKAKFPAAIDYEFEENLYDAAYFMLLSYAAAGSTNQYTGADLERGVKRLISGEPIDVGPEGFSEAMGVFAKSASASISLNGCLGPPNFDSDGIRKGTGAVYCIDTTPDTGAEVKFDVLRYDEHTSSLVGDVPCFTF